MHATPAWRCVKIEEGNEAFEVGVVPASKASSLCIVFLIAPLTDDMEVV